MKILTSIALSLVMLSCGLAQTPPKPMVVTGSLETVMQDLQAVSLTALNDEMDAQAAGTKPLQNQNTTEGPYPLQPNGKRYFSGSSGF